MNGDVCQVDLPRSVAGLVVGRNALLVLRVPPAMSRIETILHGFSDQEPLTVLCILR